jgi:hypothetical protein
MNGKHLEMTPAVWGPSTWSFLHLLTFAYPEKPTDYDRQIHRQFLYSFASILPCEVCRNHFDKRIRRCIEEGALNSRESYVRCMWGIHRDVDPKKSLTFPEFIALYKKIMERGHLNPIKEMEHAKYWMMVSVLLGTLLMIGGLYLVYKKS